MEFYCQTKYLISKGPDVPLHNEGLQQTQIKVQKNGWLIIACFCSMTSVKINRNCKCADLVSVISFERWLCYSKILGKLETNKIIMMHFEIYRNPVFITYLFYWRTIFSPEINTKYSVRWYHLKKSSFPFPWERYIKRNPGCICSWQHSRDSWILGKFLSESISPEMKTKRRDNSGVSFVPRKCGLWAISPPYECPQYNWDQTFE